MKIKNIILFTCIGFMLGLVASVMSTYNVWLDMRVHARHIIWGFMLIGFIFGFKFEAKIYYFFLCEFFLIVFCFIGKLDTIYCNFRESFLPSVSLNTVKPIFNIKMLFFNVVALIFLYIKAIRKKGKNNE